jgi:hypothetical protein
MTRLRRENYAYNGNTLFHSRISPWDVTPGQSKGSAVNHEPLQIALENGAIRAMVPISNEVQFAALPEETVEKRMLSSTGTWIAQFSRLSNSDACCSATIRIAQSVRSQQTSRQSLPTPDWAGASQLFAAQFRKPLERLGTIMKGQRQERLALDLVLRGWTRALARPSC